MLRNFFEGLGELFQATFKILPFAGDTVNRIFMLIIAGGLLYWVLQMRKHKAAAAPLLLVDKLMVTVRNQMLYQ